MTKESTIREEQSAINQYSVPIGLLHQEYTRAPLGTSGCAAWRIVNKRRYHWLKLMQTGAWHLILMTSQIQDQHRMVHHRSTQISISGHSKSLTEKGVRNRVKDCPHSQTMMMASRRRVQQITVTRARLARLENVLRA